MPEAWELLHKACVGQMAREAAVGIETGADGRGRFREAIRAAERDVIERLRHDLSWSLINSHLLALELNL